MNRILDIIISYEYSSILTKENYHFIERTLNDLEYWSEQIQLSHLKTAIQQGLNTLSPQIKFFAKNSSYKTIFNPLLALMEEEREVSNNSDMDEAHEILLKILDFMVKHEIEQQFTKDDFEIIENGVTFIINAVDGTI